MDYKISGELLDEIASYLGKQPYQEVATLISKLVKLVESQKAVEKPSISPREIGQGKPEESPEQVSKKIN